MVEPSPFDPTAKASKTSSVLDGAPGLSRVIAYLIDAVVLGIASAVVWGILFVVLLPIEIVSTLFGLPGIAVSSVTSVIGIVGVALLYASPWQATPGKRMMQLKVTDADGNRLSFVHALVRVVVMAASFLIPVGIVISGIMIFVHPERRALHDLVASTRVFHENE